MKPGDWICPDCMGIVFASKSVCKCGKWKPKELGGISGINGASTVSSNKPAYSPRPGDWICPQCNGNVFASKSVCRCGHVKTGSIGSTNTTNTISESTPVSTPVSVIKPGDWTCPKCNDNVFASRMFCRCGEPKSTNLNSNLDALNCVICLTNPKDTLLKTCKHICMCNGCANQMTNKRCPICRKPFEMTDLERIFIS